MAYPEPTDFIWSSFFVIGNWNIYNKTTGYIIFFMLILLKNDTSEFKETLALVFSNICNGTARDYMQGIIQDHPLIVKDHGAIFHCQCTK